MCGKVEEIELWSASEEIGFVVGGMRDHVPTNEGASGGEGDWVWRKRSPGVKCVEVERPEIAVERAARVFPTASNIDVACHVR